MAVKKVTYYSVSASYNGGTWSAGPQLSPNFTLPYGQQWYDGQGYWWVMYVVLGGQTLLAPKAWTSLSAGAPLYRPPTSPSNWNTFQLATVAGSTTIVNEGNRIIKVACSAGGTVTTPSIAGEQTAVVVTRPSGDISVAVDFLTITAGDGAANTGTLLSQGFTAGTWANWTWPAAVFTSGQQTSEGASTAKTITLSLVEGMADGTITANFTRSQNSPSLWSPFAQNVIVHILNSSLVETDNSVNYLTNWPAFRAKGFTALSVGAAARDWYVGPGDANTGVYLMNVPTAAFAVTPTTGMRVYKWTLEKADASVVEFGSNNPATLDGFEEGCKVHLYLTSATPNPRIVYDGFDAASDPVPSDQRIIVDGAAYPVGETYISSGPTTPRVVNMSPVAWATRVLGQERSVIVDGVATVLSNVANTGASVTSASTPFAVNHVKFKQVPLATTGVLTVTATIDTIVATPPTISLAISQESTLLETLTASGHAHYYAGSGPLSIVANVDYKGNAPANFALRIVPTIVYEGDVIGTNSASLIATDTARAVSFYLTQLVSMGTLDEVAVHVTRDVTTGTEIATSAGPVTQSYAGGISVTMPAVATADNPLYVECYANTGYTLKALHVTTIDGVSPALTFYAGPAPSTATAIHLNIPRANDGVHLKVVLVMAADIVGTPSILPALPDDLGKFTATVAHTGTSYPDFRVGDSVTLAAGPYSSITGIAIGSPLFNGAQVSPIRTGVAIAATVTLAPGENVFKVPTYVVFTPSASGASPSITTTWDVTDSLLISAVTYYRIGSVFTVTVPLTSGSPVTTVISARINRRIIASGAAAYAEVGVLLPAIPTVTTNRTFTGTLRGETQCIAIYTAGVAYPIFSVAAFDYGTNTYMLQGVRPSVRTLAVSPAALADNTVSTVTWPGSGTPGDAYKAAAFLVQAITTSAVLPQVEIRPSSTVSARLEMWNPTTSVWLPYVETIVTLDVAFNYFRVAIGDAPADLVNVLIEEAEDTEGTAVPGCVVYATSGVVYDGNFALPTTVQARARYVLHARVTPPYGYVVTGWYVDGVLTASGASISVVVLDTGLTLKPQLAVRQVAAASVMIMNADPNRTDEGIWVSKLFRAQYPWKPLTANVVARPSTSPVTLGVMKDGGDAPTALNTDNPGTVAITAIGDGMRRLPPGQIQKTRFVRYMVVAYGEVSISSVAIGSGSETMKGGH